MKQLPQWKGSYKLEQSQTHGPQMAARYVLKALLLTSGKHRIKVSSLLEEQDVC